MARVVIRFTKQIPMVAIVRALLLEVTATGIIGRPEAGTARTARLVSVALL